MTLDRKTIARESEELKMKKPKTKRVTGILPGDEWLRANGHGELVDWMEEHPEMVAHILRDNPPKSGKTDEKRSTD